MRLAEQREETVAALLYDAFTNPAAAGPWVDFIPAAGTRVLLMPARTGRLSALLALRGMHVYGIDQSTPFLKIAERRRQDLTPEAAGRLRLIPADYSRLQIDELKFDAALLPGAGLSLLEGAAAGRHALAGVWRHLMPGGRLWLAVPVPPPAGASPGQLAGAERHRPARPEQLPRGWTASRRLEEWWAGSGRLRRVHDFWVEDGADVRRVRWVEERFLLAPDDVMQMLSELGFRQIEVLADRPDDAPEPPKHVGPGRKVILHAVRPRAGFV